MKIAERLAYKAASVNAISAEDHEIYVYSYRMFFRTIALWLSAIAVGLLSRQFLGVMVFMAFFVPLRQYAGGIHIKSGLVCYLCTVGVFALVALIPHLAFWETVQNILWIMLPASVMVIIRYAPQEDENKPASENEKLHFRKMARLILGIEIIAGIALGTCAQNSSICLFALFGTNLSAILVISKVLSKRRKAA